MSIEGALKHCISRHGFSDKAWRGQWERDGDKKFFLSVIKLHLKDHQEVVTVNEPHTHGIFRKEM